MITLSQYFINRPHSQAQEDCAIGLLSKVNPLIDYFRVQTGNDIPLNVHTNSRISGLTEGGFRLPDCPQGKPFSSHKILEEYFPQWGIGAGIDIHDPHEQFDNWLTDDILEEFDLYREAPESTIGWTHLTDRRPHSGHRTFLP